MPKTPRLSVNYAMLCDDVRFEDNGKLLIVGVYGPDILVTKFPAKIRVMLLLNFSSDSGGDVDFEVRVKSADGSAVAGAKGQLEVSGRTNNSFLPLPGTILSLSSAGDLKFQFRTVGSRWKTVMSIEIGKNAAK